MGAVNRSLWIEATLDCPARPNSRDSRSRVDQDPVQVKQKPVALNFGAIQIAPLSGIIPALTCMLGWRIKQSGVLHRS